MSSPLYHVVTAAHHDRSVVASCSIAEGQSVLVERSVWTCEGASSEALLESFAQLPASLQSHVLEHFIGGDPVGIVHANSHADGEPPGMALYEMGSMMNHSCENNVRTRPLGPATREWFAGEEISAGAELTQCYMEQSCVMLLAPLQVRRQYIMRHWGFHCRCTRCVREEKLGLRLTPQQIAFYDGLPSLTSLNDAQCVALFESQSDPLQRAALLQVFGTRVSLMRSLCAHLPLLLELPRGDRRCCASVLAALEQVLPQCSHRDTRQAALDHLHHLSSALQVCVTRGAFMGDALRQRAVEASASALKTLEYAADTSGTPCCLGCYLTIRPPDTTDADSQAEKQDESWECAGDFDWEVAEEYDDIVL